MSYSREEIEAVEAQMAAHNILPVDTLRQNFFDDLDASSKVNPNRSRASTRMMDSEEERKMFQALRTATLSRFGEQELPDETVQSNPADRQHLVDSPPGSSQRRREPSQPRRTSGRPSTSLYEVRQQNSGDEAGFARASCAVLTNLVAGSLCGLALRRLTSVAAGNITAVVVGTQILCYLGYATVRWGDLVHDVLALVCRGYRPAIEEPRTRIGQKREQLLVTLTATIPRRASFWGGVAIGVICLD